MDTRFLPHNAHREDPAGFRDRDPHLRFLSSQPLVHRPALLDRLPMDEPGIYTVGGGRQVGKTTLLKMWMERLLGAGIGPGSIAYLTGEVIDDHHSLIRLVDDCLAEMPQSAMRFLAIDEITYIKEWDRALKYLYDAGLLERTVAIVSGSDLGLIKEARKRFPGRRGRADVVDFHLAPLSFREAVRLGPGGVVDDLMDAGREVTKHEIEVLDAQLLAYLIHGGYLTAMNDIARSGTILPSTFATYSDWVRGDFLKRGKREGSLREVVGAVSRRLGSQVTWNSLAKELSIDHPATVMDYVELLVSMDVLLVLPALVEDKLEGAPKKARKVLFRDPFIFHALRSWLHPSRDPYTELVLPFVQDPADCSLLVEACVASHVARLSPTYYIKAEGEVDVAYVEGRRFWPVEVKWSGRVGGKDLKQLRKYPNGRILARVTASGQIEGIPVEPLVLFLYKIGCPAADQKQ